MDSAGFLRSGGQREQEPAALTWNALSPDAAAVLFHDAAAECEAKASAAQRAGIRCIPLLKAIEDALELFRRNATALIFDDEADFAKV